MTAETLVAGAKILQKPINDLYEIGKSAAKNQLSKWRSTKNINQLYKNIYLVQKVKTIWQVDKEVKLMSFYYPSKLTIDDKPRSISGVKDLPQENHIVIQGTVGQGKSIFLRYLCLRELSQGLRIPIFLELRRIERGRNLRAFIFDGFRTLGFDIDDRLFEFYANSGKFILLLDAFDELDSDLATSVIDELERMAQAYPRLQILVTSRPDSGIERSAHFRVYKLAPLTESDHGPFLEKIVPEKKKVNEILKAVKQNSAKIGSLLTTPLMMTLLVIIYKAEQTIPDELSEFYDNLFQTLLTRHDKSKPGFVRKRYCKLGERQIRDLFEAFCFVTRQKELSILSEDQVHDCVKIGSTHSGIACDAAPFLQDMTKVICLMQEEGFKYHFIHKSVQEYHAASFVRHCPEEMASTFYAKLHEKSRWQAWRQELTFLSHIDEFRFLKYFKFPLLLSMLRHFNVDVDDLPSSSNVKTELTYEDAREIFRASMFTLRKSDIGFTIATGLLGQTSDYILHDFELKCFHAFWREVAFGKVFPLELESIVKLSKSGAEDNFVISVPEFMDGANCSTQFLRAVNSVFKSLLSEYNRIKEVIAREEGKKQLLELK